jgi:hypothetical protein
MQSMISFKSIVNKEKLLSFAAGKRIEMVIDETFERADKRLTLRLQEFSFGLADGPPARPSQSAPPGRRSVNSREFRERALIALYRHAMRHGVDGYYDPKEIADTAGLTWRPGQLRMVMVSLDNSGLIRLSQTMGGGDDGGMDAQLTQHGIEEAEDMIERNIEYQEDEEETYSVATIRPASSWVPGSDRYVPITDNQRQALQADVAELKELVRGDNSIEASDRDIVLYEIAIFEAAIAPPCVSTELIQRFVNGALEWVGRTIVNAAASEIVKRLMVTLAGLA